MPPTNPCSCGTARLVIVLRNGERLESCERDRARYLALYGEPTTFTWAEA